MLNEEFAKWWEEAKVRLNSSGKVRQLCKEAFIYGVNTGVSAVMDSKMRDQIFEDLKNDDT